MSGHSKWATIKRKKGVTDARRGQLFTKLAREITVAARDGGGDPEANFRLRLAVQKARQENMPNENIERAIKRGTGETGGAAYEEIIYEGYAPHGIALMIQTLTDNRNRTVSEIRAVLTRGGGSLGESGSVGWLFDQKGVIQLEIKQADPEEVALSAIDAGADDVKIEDGNVEAYAQFEDLKRVEEALEGQGLHVVGAETEMIPKASVPLDEKDAIQVMKLMDKLEDLEDVQRVYSNLDIPDELAEAYGE